MQHAEPAATHERYHHGDLRRALIDAAVGEIAENGPGALNLRELARTIGVSHAAPRHHFGDKRGLLTAIATDGFRLLGDELRTSWESTHSFLELGVAYVRFALAHRAHFEVMFRPDLLQLDDPALVAARTITNRQLYGSVTTVAGAATEGDPRLPAIAAWALVHGLATLWLAGNLPDDVRDDPESLTRAVARHLFRG